MPMEDLPPNQLPAEITGTTLTAQPVVRTRTWWHVIGMVVLGLVIFGSGLLTGVTGTLIAVKRRMQINMQFPEEAPDRLLPFLKKRLKLTPEQYAKIDPIIREHHANLRGIRKDVEPKISLQFHQIEAEVDQILDDSQRKMWHGWFDKMRAFWLPPLKKS
jgi:hypothetical protein